MSHEEVHLEYVKMLYEFTKYSLNVLCPLVDLETFGTWAFGGDCIDLPMIDAWNKKHGDLLLIDEEPADLLRCIPKMISLYKEKHDL